MSEMRLPSFTEWLSGLKPDEGPQMRTFKPSMRERIPMAVQDGLIAVGMKPQKAGTVARRAAEVLDYTPVGASADAYDSGTRAALRPTAAGKAAALGGGALMAAIGAVPGGKAALRGGEKLAMDEAARMARATEQGFDVSAPLYHGTNADISEFNPSTFGASGPGVYTTGSADIASEYATGRYGRQGGATVMPMFGPSKTISAPEFEALSRQLADTHGLGMTEADTLAAKTLSEQGIHGVKNGRTVNVFDPANIRSKFAAFDPEKRNSKNLLAGVAGAAVGIPSFTEFLAQQQPEPDL